MERPTGSASIGVVQVLVRFSMNGQLRTNVELQKAGRAIKNCYGVVVEKVWAPEGGLAPVVEDTLQVCSKTLCGYMQHRPDIIVFAAGLTATTMDNPALANIPVVAGGTVLHANENGHLYYHWPQRDITDFDLYICHVGSAAYPNPETIDLPGNSGFVDVSLTFLCSLY